MAKKFVPTITIRKGACKHTIDIHPVTPDDTNPLHINWNALSRDDRKVTYRALMDFARRQYGGQNQSR